MLKALVLEDDPNRVIKFKQVFIGQISALFVSTAREAIAHLRTGTFDVIFLDHDLGGRTFVDPKETNTGSEVARWIKKNKVSGKIIVHSYNDKAAPGMVKLMKGSVYLPGIWNSVIFDEEFPKLKL